MLSECSNDRIRVRDYQEILLCFFIYDIEYLSPSIEIYYNILIKKKSLPSHLMLGDIFGFERT